MPTSTATLTTILEKMENLDPDIRFMATSDLTSYLKSPDDRTDFDLQKRLCRSIIKLLQDTSTEVQGMAMKCLAPLAAFVQVEYAVYLVDKLLEPLVDGSKLFKPMRDVAFLGLKNILADLTASDKKLVKIAQCNVPKILSTIGDATKTDEVYIEALELVNELLKKLGSLFSSEHDAASDVILCKLSSPSSTVRKRAVACVGSLGSVCHDKLFDKVMKVIIRHLTDERSETSRRTGVQALWALARTSGSRLGTYLPTVFPIIFDYCRNDAYEEDNELREYCVQAIESFCTLCQKQMKPFIGDVKDLLLKLAKHDPYFAGDDETDFDDAGSDVQDMEEDSADGVDDDDFLDDDDGDFSDDDDTSWKVRRASIRCIHAVISVQLLPCEDLHSSFGLFLVSRFGDRAEIVKIDAFSAFISLLRTKFPNVPYAVETTACDANCAMEVDSIQRRVGPLGDNASRIVRIVRKELSNPSGKVRIKAMSVISELVTAIPDAFCSLFGKVVAEVERCLADDAAQLKSETLRFLQNVLTSSGPEYVHPFVGRLVPKIIAASEDRYYKVTAETLRLIASILSVFGKASEMYRSSISPLCCSIFDAADSRIGSGDQDSEVMVAALACMGAVVSYFGEFLDAKRLLSVGNTLSSRLKNEVTRIASGRAMLQIARSKHQHVFDPVASSISKAIVSILRQKNHDLQTISLELLANLPQLAVIEENDLLRNVGLLISESNMELSYYALTLCSVLLKTRGAEVCPALAVEDGVYRQILSLTTSPLLQGRVITALLSFFHDLAKVDGEPLAVSRVVGDLNTMLGSVEISMSQEKTRSSPLNILARCIASVSSGAHPSYSSAMTTDLVKCISNNNSKERVFSLITLGEFGKRSLLTKELPEVQKAMLNVLDSSDVEVRTAAALAMGGLASSRGDGGIPSLVVLIHERPQIRYLLLLSLKDAIAFSSESCVSQSSELLLDLLLKFIPESLGASNSVQDEQERRKSADSIRIAASECLGLLVRIIPRRVIGAIRNCISSDTADVRAIVAAALRFAVSTGGTGANNLEVLWAELEPIISDFVILIKDSDVGVAKDTLLTFHALARSRPMILSSYMEQLVPLVFDRTEKNEDLVRIIDLGPFKHSEDFGLDLRKAAFAVMRTFVSGPLASHLPMDAFLSKVVVGLRDVHDARAVAQQTVIALAATPYGAHLRTSLKPIISALEVSLNERLKENPVRQEVERHAESIRGILRTFVAMENVVELEKTSEMSIFKTEHILRNHSEPYNTAKNESKFYGVSVEEESPDVMRD